MKRAPRWAALGCILAMGCAGDGGDANDVDQGSGFWQDVPAPTPPAGTDPAAMADSLPPNVGTGTPTDSPIIERDPVIEPPPTIEPPTDLPTAGTGEPPVDVPMAGTDAPPPTNPDDPYDALRQACVEHINMYRATLGLDPVARATPEQEACSDLGAKADSEEYAATMMAHGSAGSCPGLGAQNTCPGWPLWGNATIESNMIQCLDQMWAEGEPPVSLSACIADYSGCFLMHGHYINMSSETARVVSCGFYEMPNGSIWMNQDFGR